jgi:hypothetical protein
MVFTSKTDNEILENYPIGKKVVYLSSPGCGDDDNLIAEARISTYTQDHNGHIDGFVIDDENVPYETVKRYENVSLL